MGIDRPKAQVERASDFLARQPVGNAEADFAFTIGQQQQSFACYLCLFLDLG